MVSGDCRHELNCSPWCAAQRDLVALTDFSSSGRRGDGHTDPSATNGLGSGPFPGRKAAWVTPRKRMEACEEVRMEGE